MRALYLKLTFIFFVLFGVVVFTVVYNQKKSKPESSSPFYTNLKVGEWYGSIKVSEVLNFQTKVVDSLIQSYFSYDETIQEILEDRLKELGLFNTTIYFSGSFSDKVFYAYTPLHKATAIATELGSIASTLDWNRLDTLEQTIYTTNQKNIKIIQTSEVLIFTNSNEQTFDYFTESETSRFVDLDSLFARPNQFAFQTPLMQSLGIDYVDLSIDFSLPLSLNGSAYTAAAFPFSKGDQSPVLELSDANYQAGSNITIDTSLFTAAWYDWFEGLKSEYGFSLSSVFKSWDGTASFVKGGAVVSYDTIVTYGFDDNFNEVATKKIIKNNVEGFSIALGSRNSNKMKAALQQNNFLSFENGKYFFPMSPALYLRQDSDQLLMSSYNNHEFLQQKNKHSFYLNALQEGWFMDANIDRKSSKLMEFDVTVGIISVPLK